MALTVTPVQQEYSIQSYGANWWISYQSEWIGYSPHSLWGGTYTKSGLVQWFGEVAATTAQTCTDMGNGLPGTAAGAALTNTSSFSQRQHPPSLSGHLASTICRPGQVERVPLWRAGSLLVSDQAEENRSSTCWNTSRGWSGAAG